MHPVMTRLGQDHARLVMLLDLFETLLNQFHEGSEPDYDLMTEMLEYLDSYCDTVHHLTEELLFRRLLEKGTVHHEVFDVLMRQHAGVGQLNNRFRQALDGILNEEVLLREDVEADGRELIATMRAHLMLEESEAFPVLREQLTDEDWEVLTPQVPLGDDPVFGTLDPERFKALYRYLATQAREQEQNQDEEAQ